MATGGEQAGYVAIGVAIVGATAQVIDRMIQRWHPRKKRTTDAEQVEKARVELAAEWQVYRAEVSQQLHDCRAESEAQRTRLLEYEAVNSALRGQVATLTIQVSVMRAQLRAHGIEDAV